MAIIEMDKPILIIKGKKFTYFELCPLLACKEYKLIPIYDEDKFVIAFYCGNCGNSWDLNDLLIPLKKPQKSLFDF